MATVKKVKKAQRGGCVSNMSGAQRQRYFQSAYGPSPLQKAGQAIKNVFTGGKTKEERQEARAEKKAARAAKKSVPGAKYGKGVKKAQDGSALTEMGKKTTRAAINKRTNDMAKSLDKASVFGKNYIAPSDSVSKARPKGMNFDKKSFDKLPSLDKLKKKNAPKKEMKYGGKAKKMMSGGKCKYGC
jgi:hypothetical protein